MRDLRGRVAVVTGAASGLGLGLSRRLLVAGVAVAMVDVDEAVVDVAASLTGSAEPGARVLPVVADVASRAAVDAAASTITSELGAVDLFFANAGVTTPPTPIEHLPQQAWEWVLGVNLWGLVHGMRSFLPGMLERGTGRIVATASMLGVDPAALSGPYAASKAAVIATCLSVHKQLSETGVGVSIVLPHVRSNIMDARRTWPARLGRDPWTNGGDAYSRDDPATDGAHRRYVEAGMDPDAAAGAVVDGVRDDRLWIMPGADDATLRAALHPRWPSA